MITKVFRLLASQITNCLSPIWIPRAPVGSDSDHSLIPASMCFDRCLNENVRSFAQLLGAITQKWEPLDKNPPETGAFS